MFPLAGHEFPKNAEELAVSIRGALEQVLLLAGGRESVRVAGGSFPELESLSINLDDAGVNLGNPPPRPRPAGERQGGIRVGQLDVSAKPIRYQKSRLYFEMAARGVALDCARDESGRPLLVLAGADEGHVKARIDKRDIEALLLELVTMGAERQGVKVQALELALMSDGPRSIAMDARVRAKKMGISGVIVIRGRVDIDDGLNATFSNLQCEGEGMVGTVAAKLIQPKVHEYQGKRIPLVAFSLGDLRLRDVKIALGDALQVEASFGSGGGSMA